MSSDETPTDAPSTGDGEAPRFERLTLVILMRGPKAEEIGDERLQALQREHLAHMAEMRDRGKLLIAGPFGEQDDDAFRGMCLYDTGVEEARRLAAADPAVVAGRLRLEVMSWHFHQGQLAFPGRDR